MGSATKKCPLLSSPKSKSELDVAFNRQFVGARDIQFEIKRQITQAEIVEVPIAEVKVKLLRESGHVDRYRILLEVTSGSNNGEASQVAIEVCQ